MTLRLLFFCVNLALVASFTSVSIQSRQNFVSNRLSMAAEGVDKIAVEAARQAGAIMLEGRKAFKLSEVMSKQGSRDILTEYDTKCQEKIYEVIKDKFPEHAFLGEEDVEPGREAATKAIELLSEEDHLWIVDPIDGTTNFAHSMAISGIIIAYCKKGLCTFGLIYDPYSDEMFTAWRGKGAYMNGHRISVDKVTDIRDAVLCTGSPPNLDSLQGCLNAQTALSSQCRTMRILGSAAINLAWVACGRLSSYFETDMNVWDVAAGSLLVEEAGGRVSDVWGQPYRLQTRSYVCSNGAIHDALQKRLLEAGMVMPGS
jgi:myo-inositol-1(or 4)-monophosphatase